MIRIPRIKRKHVSGFTTVNNVYLRDVSLGLTERGLLTTMLSLPDSWEFSGRGLAAILPDGRDKVFASLRKLEEHGYLQRNKITLKGKVVDYEYEFCDCPVFPKRELSNTKKRKPRVSLANQAKPHPENPDTVNKYDNKYTIQSDGNLDVSFNSGAVASTPSTNKTSSNDTSSLLFDRQEGSVFGGECALTYIPAPNSNEIANIKSAEEMRRLVKSRIIMYDYCVHKLLLSPNDIDFVVEVLVEMLYSKKKQWIGGRYVGVRQIREKVCNLDSEKVAYILQTISNNARGIKNYKQHLKAAIINFSDELL